MNRAKNQTSNCRISKSQITTTTTAKVASDNQFFGLLTEKSDILNCIFKALFRVFN